MEKQDGNQWLNAGEDEFKPESWEKSSVLNVVKHWNKLIEGTADASSVKNVLIKLFMGLSAGVNSVNASTRGKQVLQHERIHHPTGLFFTSKSVISWVYDRDTSWISL